MIFRKKRGMIDVRELARQGKIVPMGRKTVGGDANKDGFVELGKTNAEASATPATGSMNFFDTPIANEPVNNSGLTERITGISKKVSKIEQRLELIEKKLGLGDSSPPMMW
ncbi:hypothetical protein HN747_01215 [archaeon]|jgi:hypothetical protein|nr:hypothetical protein [archaeon]